MPETDILEHFPALKEAGISDLKYCHLNDGDIHTTTSKTIVSPIPGRTAKGIADLFGLKGQEVKLSTNMDDHSITTLESDGPFDFAGLFPQIHFDDIDLLLFKDVKMHLEQFRYKHQVETAIIFEGMLDMTIAPLAKLGELLKIKDAIHISGEIDMPGEDITKELQVDFIRVGSSASFYAPLADGIVLKKAELQFTIHRKVDIADMKLGWDYGIMLSGILELSNLGKKPVSLDCCVSYNNSNLHVQANSTEIENLFDINGLDLESLHLGFTIGTNPEIELEAVFQTGLRTYRLGGILSGNAAGLYTSVENFDLHDLNDIYASLTGEQLHLPGYEIKFDKVMLGIASSACRVGSISLDEGLTIQCEAVVHQHTCKGFINISTKGVYLSGSVSDISFEGIDLKTAKLELYIYGAGSGKPSGFSISGITVIKEIQLGYELTLERLNGNWQYLLYAALEAKSTKISNVFPSLKDSFADSIHFSSLVFIYSSADTLTSHSEHSYTVRKGIQLMGMIDSMPALDQLTRKPRKNNNALIFSAYYGSTVELGIEMPEMIINLGDSVTSEPLKISLELTPPSFKLNFGLGIIPVGQLTPLKFYLLLKLGLLNAEGSVSMKGDWENALGVAGLTVSDVGLSVGIFYEQFFTTGTPSELGLTGKIKMGYTELAVGVKISENPAEEIMTGELKHLSAKDLIQFAASITSLKIQEKDIPDFFFLEELKFYAAPNGGRIGVFSFEPGFSFSARLVLFGKHASVYTRFSSSGIVAKGHLDHLELGPLKITGRHGADAELELEISQQRQYFKIDGAFEFFGTGIGIYAEISKEGVEFDFQQKFLGLLDFTIYAKSTAFRGDPSGFDFILSATFNNYITDYLKTTFTENIRYLIHMTEVSIDEAQRTLDQKQKDYEAAYNPAFERLQDADKKAQQYLNSCKEGLEKQKRDFNAHIAGLRADAKRITNEWNAKINTAVNDVSGAQQRFDNNIRKAEADVVNAKKDFENRIGQCAREVEAARKVYTQKKDEIDWKFRSAQSDVQSLRNELNDAYHEYNNLSFPSSLYRGPYLTGKIGGLEVAIRVGSGLVSAAQTLVNGFSKGIETVAFDTARETLELAQKGVEKTLWNGAITLLQSTRTVETNMMNAAKDFLIATRNKSRELIATAEKAVEVAETAGHDLVLKAENQLLNIASSTAYGTLNTAEKVLEVIRTGTKRIAFDTASANLLLARKISTSVLGLGELIAKHAGDLIDIKHIKLTAQLSRIKKGELFIAEIDIVLLGVEYKWNDLRLDVSNIETFIRAFFEKITEQLKLLVPVAAK